MTDSRSNDVGRLRGPDLPRFSTNRAGKARSGRTALSDVSGRSDQSGFLERRARQTAVEENMLSVEGQKTDTAREPAAVSGLPVAAAQSMPKYSTGANHRAHTAPARKRRATDLTAAHAHGKPPSYTVSDTTPVSTIPLSPRLEVVAVTRPYGFPGGSVGARGTEAGCGWPLVPQPSLPRSQAESHPW